MFNRGGGGGGGSRGWQRCGSNGPGFGKLLGALPIELVCVRFCTAMRLPRFRVSLYLWAWSRISRYCRVVRAQVVVTFALLSNKALTPMPGPGRPDHTLNAHNTDTAQQALHHMEHRS